MTIQSVSILATTIVILIIAAVFLRVRLLSSDSRDYTPVLHNAYAIRAALFGAMVIVGLPVTIWLLRDTPYSAQPEPSQIVTATGSQWYWDLEPDSAPAGTPVEFQVSSTDVNHGFGIYDESGEIVAQAQAMPGYVNRLTHVFDKPGTYRIMCLEYCGLAHHDMIAQFEVTAPEAAVAEAGAGAGDADGNSLAGVAGQGTEPGTTQGAGQGTAQGADSDANPGTMTGTGTSHG